MPYKGLDTLKAKITDPAVREWAEELNPNSKTTLFAVLKYFDWLGKNGYWKTGASMLDDHAKCLRSTDEKVNYRHLEIAKKYLKSKGTGLADRKNTFSAIRSFYAFHHRPLQALTRNEAQKLFEPSPADTKRATELGPLTVEEVHRLVLNLRQPYKAIITVLLQGAMGLAEFQQFNHSTWRQIEQDLEKPGPVKVNLYRSKTSRGMVAKYFTFLSEDSKRLIKEWLQIRPKVDLPELFVVFRKNDGKWVPVASSVVEKNVTTTAKRTGLITPSALNRYRVHPHELRDLFKSLCSLNGVAKVASEYFLGHAIDKSGYDKSPEYDVEFFRNEYRKVEPFLNILSNPKGLKVQDDLSKGVRKELLLTAGYSTEEIEQMNNLSDDELHKKIRERLLGTRNNLPKQKVIPSSDVEKYLKEGYEFVDKLSDDRAIVKAVT